MRNSFMSSRAQADHFRRAAKAALSAVGMYIDAKRRHRPSAFAFQLSAEGLRAAEQHLHQLGQILDRDVLAPSVTPASRAATDRAFQEFLVVQGLKSPGGPLT